MSDGHKRKQQEDVGGRVFLGLLGSLLIVVGILIVFGLTEANEFAGVPLIVLGAVLAVLAGFHSRIGGGPLVFGKFQVPIVAAPEHEKKEPAAKPVSIERRPAGGREPSVGQVRAAAENPATERHREDS